MKKAATNFSEGDLVFAKVRGYPAWPARISSPADQRGQRFNVFFYGTYETAICKQDEMWPFNEESKARYGKQKRKGFVEALLEIEHNPDIYLEISNRAIEESESGVDTSAMNVSGVESDAAAATDNSQMTPTVLKNKKRPNNKRKAEESPAEPRPAKQPKTKTPTGKTSRAGRAIKEKKTFVEDSPVASPVSESPRSGQRKMWVCVKSTGELIELNLDKDRPISFDSKENEIQWERTSAINALRFKANVEAGVVLPEEVRLQLEKKTALTPQEEEILMRDKKASVKQEKLTWLRIEQRLVDLNYELHKALSRENPDMSEALDLLREFQTTSVSPLMFKKQPQLVETVRKLRKYVGPVKPSPDPRETNEWKFLSEKIRIAADDVFSKIQAAFCVTEGTDKFVAFFSNAVEDFKLATAELPEKKRLCLVSDPTVKKSVE